MAINSTTYVRIKTSKQSRFKDCNEQLLAYGYTHMISC